MNKLFSILALVWFAAVARAANPSFSAFDANFFQVTGTGNGSIKIKTNAFTWLNAGGGPWVLNNGTLSNSVSSTVSNGVFSSSIMLGDMSLFAFQQKGTNQLQVWKDGGLFSGYSQPVASGVALSSQRYTEIGESQNQLLVSHFSDTNTSRLSVDTIQDYGVDFILWHNNDDNTLDTRFEIETLEGSAYASLKIGGTTRLLFEPSASDGSTPHLLDTSAPHTTGNLLEVKNAGLTPFAVNYAGGLLIGSNALSFWGALGGEIMVAVKDTGKGDVDNAEMWMGILRGDGAFTGVDSDPRTNTFNWRIVVNNQDRVQLKPTANDGLAPFILSSAKPHTSGPLFTLLNTNAVEFEVDWAGTITPGSSNTSDIGSALLPYRTNYAKAFTVIGSQRTVAYSESGTIYLDADAIRLRGNLPLTTNVVIPLVATLNITNGLIMSVTGP